MSPENDVEAPKSSKKVRLACRRCRAKRVKVRESDEVETIASCYGYVERTEKLTLCLAFNFSVMEGSQHVGTV